MLVEGVPYLNPQDRPDILACVFRMKQKELMCDLVHRKVFGHVISHMEVNVEEVFAFFA